VTLKALETHRSWDPAFSTVWSFLHFFLPSFLLSFLPSFFPSYFLKQLLMRDCCFHKVSIVCKITSINKDFSETKGSMLRRWSSLDAAFYSSFAELR
jgi:hypothetical protein